MRFDMPFQTRDVLSFIFPLCLSSSLSGCYGLLPLVVCDVMGWVHYYTWFLMGSLYLVSDGFIVSDFGLVRYVFCFLIGSGRRTSPVEDLIAYHHERSRRNSVSLNNVVGAYNWSRKGPLSGFLSGFLLVRFLSVRYVLKGRKRAMKYHWEITEKQACFITNVYVGQEA